MSETLKLPGSIPGLPRRGSPVVGQNGERGLVLEPTNHAACGRQHPAPAPAPAPHTCPVCTGAGKVSRPPWVAGDVSAWGASDTRTYPCQACNGTGIVWWQP